MAASDEAHDEVQELTWALIDEQATEADIARLELLLTEDEEARRTYVMCMQMHADLHYLLSGKSHELPAAVKQAMEAEAKRAKAAPSKAPLPLVDMPVTADSPVSSSFAL